VFLLTLFVGDVMVALCRWRLEPKECLVGWDSIGYIHRKQVFCASCIL